MATNTLNVRMKQAVRTEAEWTSDNPVLLEGEVAYSSDKNNMYKVGDGTKTWSQLSYNNASTVNGHTVNADVPSGAKFTDTVTTATTTGSGNAVTAITASNGALTVTKGTTFLTSHQDISGKADKSATVSNVAWDSTNKKLTKTINGTTSDVVTAATLRSAINVADGAEVNQNAFSNVTIGSTTIAADTKTDTLTLVAGSNITLTPDATNDKVTIAATDTTYNDATTSAHGLMTAAMVTKLNGIDEGADVNQNAYSSIKIDTFPISATSTTDTFTIATGSNVLLQVDDTNKKLTINATDTTYSSKTAASGGTDVSLVTTGEKYTWNNKLSSVPIASSSTLGGIKVGDGLSIAADGTLSSSGGGGGTNIGITYDPTNEIIYITTGGVANGDEVSY